MLKTDWIRAAVEGKTVDGREITKEQIGQMATSYNRETYSALIWLEHLRGTLPDSLFKSLGTVAEVKADTISGGELDGKTALFVKLEPSPELVKMVRDGQKTHLSLEIHPNFPTTGGAYLMGIGVTDSPASIGTGIMQFSTTKRPESLFSTPIICDLGSCNSDEVETTKEEFSSFLKELKQEIMQELSKKATQHPAAVTMEEFNSLKKEFNDLKASYEKYMSEDVGINRPPAAGGHSQQYFKPSSPIGY